MKVALTLAPGATGSSKVTEVSSVPLTTAVHPAGADRLNLTPTAVEPVVFVNVWVTSWAEPGVNVVARDRLSRCTSYFAATTLAWTASMVASVGYPVVITPS